MHIRTEPVPNRGDARGALLKAWPRPVSGEVYVVEILPGGSRGHHLHTQGGEWFVALQGTVALVVEDPRDGSRAQVRLDGLRARVEAGQAHALFNLGTDVAWVLAIADVAHPDEGTVSCPVSSP